MGINTENCSIMTSSIAAGMYLQNTNCDSCTVFGSQCLCDEIRKFGIHVYNGIIKKDETMNVVIGYTPNFSYDDLVSCSQLIDRGGRLICTDADNRFAYNDNWLPGTGWIVSALESINNCKAIMVGKPNTYSLQYIMNEMELLQEELLLVGDNLTTDIKAAQNMKLASCLLLGGISQLSDVAALPTNERPDLVVDSLSKIRTLF